jgi:uncharacterized protein (DUF488 family)
MSALIYTIGHSVQPQAALIGALVEHGIEVLCDIRRYPQSRRNPQFNQRALAAALAEHGIAYEHIESLGGRREERPDSTNTALRNASFRAYADYMSTPEFAAALDELQRLAETKRVVIMCAEALPWKCHRSLVADALVSRGVAVEHIIGDKLQAHALSPVARVDDGIVTYPALL